MSFPKDYLRNFVRSFSRPKTTLQKDKPGRRDSHNKSAQSIDSSFVLESLEPRVLLSAGLTAGYAFNETAGTTAADASGHAIVGTLTNGPTWAVGQHDNAVNLDGVNDYVNLGNPASLQVTGSLTLSAWVNASTFPVDDAAVVSKRASGELGFQLDVTKDTGPRTIGFKLTNSSGSQMFRYGATTLAANTWYHIAGVYEAATQSLHVYLNGQLDDGVLQGTVTASQQNSSTTNVTIGRRAGATGYEFAGRLDDVRIYDRALTASEILDDMSSPLGAPGPDTIAPTVVAINRVGSSPTNAATVQWTVTFSEAVTGVDVTDFALAASGVTGATLTGVSGSGSSYTVTASTGTGSGTLGLNLVDNDSIVDGSANPLGGSGQTNGNFTGPVYTIDKVAPTVTINQATGQADPASTSPINFTVVFSKAVTGFTASDISFAGSTVGGTLTAQVTGTGPTYTVAVSGMTGTGTVVASVTAGAATDAAGNASAASTNTDNTVTFGPGPDTIAPTVVAINRVGSSPTNAATVQWTVTFSEAVTGVDVTDFALAASGVTGATLTGVSGSGSSYTVTASTGTGSGTLGLNLVDNDSIVDGSANPLGGSGQTNGNFTGPVYTIDKVAPTVTINQATGQADPASTSPINFTVVFSKAVTGFTASDISFAGSTVGGTLTAQVTGTGPTYTVAVSGMTGTGTVVASVTAGAATDAAGNASAASTNTDNTVTFGPGPDTIAPTVVAINRVGSSPTNAATVQWTVTFSEAVTGVDVTDFALAASGVTGATLTGVSGSGSSYTVTASTGTGSGTLGLNLVDNDSIVDGSANPLGGSGQTNGNFTGPVYTIDKVAPTVTINQATGQTDPASTSPINFTVVFSKAVTGFTTGDVTLSGTAGATTATVTGSGSTYTVAVSGMTTSGTVIATLAAGVATDAAGNASAASTSTDNTVTFTVAQTTGLTAGYAFNETTGTTTADASGNGLTGTLVNGPTFGTGKNGNGLVLDGVNDYVNLGNPASLQVTGSLTLSAWVNASTFPVDDAAVVSKRASGELGFQLDVTKDTGPRTIGFKLTNSSGSQMFRYGATTLAANTWYHIAGVYEAATQSLHVYLNGQLDDGVLQGTVTASQQNSSTTNVTIGRRAGATGYEFAGRLDDVRIYDRALTASEILDDMSSPLGAPGPDTIAPTVVAINRVGSSPTNAATVQWTVTFSEAVTGVDVTDFALAASGVTGATLTGVSGSGSSYTVTASTGTGSGTLGLNLVDNDSIVDGSANPLGGSGQTNGNFTGPVYTIDKVAPTVTINQATGQTDPASTSPINFTVVFSKAVTGFTASDISFAGSTVGGTLTAQVTGTGPTYTVAVSGMTGTGTVVASVTAGAATDAAGNASAASTNTDNTVTFGPGPDTIAPTVVAINRVGSSPTNAATVQWTVTFSEAVTGVDVTDFALAASGVTGATLTGVSGSGSSYTVTASTGTGSGTLGLNLVDNDSIVDGSANPLGGSGQTNGNFTGPVYTIDKVAPTVTINQATGQTDPASTSPINFTVVFSKAVTGFTTGDVTLSGTAGATTATVTGSGSTYTVAVSGMTTSGTVIATLAAGVATDAAGNASAASTSTDNTVTFTVAQTTGLTAGYAFNETTGTTTADASGNGLTGTLVNGPTFGTGKNGNGLVLDGVNDYVNLGNPASLQVTGSLTLSAWVNASTFPVDDAAVVSKRASGELGFQLDVTKDTGPRTIGFKLTNSSGSQMFRYGATTLAANTWYHIAGVYEAATQSLHVYLNGQLDDGVLQGTVTASQQNSSTTNVTIGRRAGATGYEFAGRLDDVRIYDRALTASEILDDMSSPLGAPGPDTIAPTVVAINRVGSSPTNAATVQWTVTFSEAVTGVDVTDFALAASGVTGATLTGVSGSGSSYTVTASTGTGSGTLGLNLVDNDSIVDGSANPLGGSGQTNGNFTGPVYTIDKVAPTVTINQATGQTDPASTSPINFTVVFSKAVTGFTASDISFAGSTVGGTLTAQVTGTGPTYTVAVSGMTGTGTVVASVTAGAATDAAGNASAASTNTDNTVTFGPGPDTIAPTVVAINRVGSSPTNAATVQWTVTFSEAVTGVDVTDFALAASGVTGATLTGVSGSGSSYTVTASTGTGSGTLGLNLVDNDSIVDGSANPLGGSGQTNGNFTGPVYTIDKVAPTVTINQATGQTDPASTSPINFTVVFSKAVTGFTTGDVTLSGTAGATTATVTGSGSTYTVAVSGMTTSGTVIATLAAGVATDAAGNASAASTSTDNTVTFTVAQTTGLTAGYAFNETTGTTTADASGNGLTGTLVNGPTFGTGKNGNGLVLDGVNDYVNLGNPASLQVTGSLTLSAWVNASTFPVDDAAVVSKRASGELGFQLDVTKDTGPRTIGFKLTNSSGSQMFRYGATTLAANTWYHIAGVYEAATQSLHVYLNGQLDDGVLQGTVTASQQNSSTTNVTIGRRAGATGYEFAGRLDDVRIYDRALTASELQTDMLTGLGGTGSTDSNPPIVQVTQPTQGALLSGIVVVSADATDDVAVASVQFYVDGVATGVLDSAAPYGLQWDTRTINNGAHTLTARAYDTSGNSTLSAPVTVNVSNTSLFRNEILATGFDLPAVLKFLPDGRALVAEVAGVIKVVPPPYTTPDPTPFLDLNLNIPGYAGIQQGIQGMALDPNFVTNHYYYVFYTNDSPNKDRLSRFTANSTLDGTIPGSEVVLYEDPQLADTEHHGGAVNFGNDGKIYLTTGDHFQGSPAQDLTSPRGKVLRINPDGTVPTDNPFYDGAGPNYDAIWALGLRNPYRAYYDAPTGRLFIGDVGGNDWSTAKEEVNLGARGANYGWPNVEGNSGNPAYTNPIYSYPHNGRDAAVTSGFVYHGTQFPSSYQGNYFFADYSQNWIKRMTFDANGNVAGVFNFEPADGSLDGPYGDIVYLTEGPDGALYYLDLGYSDVGGTFGVSKLRRIQYIQDNLPPVVQATANPTEGTNPLTVAFSSAGSSDPEGLPLTYQWTFGDGQTSTLSDPQHTYATPGLYQARLTVSDGVNSTISPPIQISVGNKPIITTFTTTPADNGLFRAGDVISFSAAATDIEDGALPNSAFTWAIDFLHGGHVHPGALLTGVTSGTFTVPTSGHDFSGDTRYRITLTVTDSSGLQTTRTSIVYPDKVNLAFDTTPSGLTIYLDGIAHTAPFVYDTLIGFNHTVEARNQTVGTSSYTFASWSDGGSQQHTITVPTSAQSYTANYTVVTNSLPSGLVAGWNFNETSGTSAQDVSGNGNTATLVNGIARTTGNYGGGLTFDGVNDYITVPDSPSLNFVGSGVTLSMWIKPVAVSGGDSVVLGKFWNPTMTSPYYQYGLELTGGTVPNFIIGTSGGPLSASMSSPLVLNQWSHLAVAFDGSQVRYYVNGVLVSTVSLTATITGRDNGFQIGADNNIQQFFKGSLDEVRIYNRALPAQEVLTDMNSAG